MNKAILTLALALCLAACGGNAGQNSDTAETPAPRQTTGVMKNDRVEVLYFHGKQRCPTCLAIEKNAKETVESRFAEQMKDGSVLFRTIDISADENSGIAEKYGVTWSALFLVSHDGGTEHSENLTEFAFANARTAPDTFKEELARKIETLLK